MDMRKYNKLQALRSKLSAVEAELQDMAMSGRDLPHNSKERKVLQEMWKMRARAREFYRLSIEEIVKEVSCDY